MMFEPTPRVRELAERLQAFMAQHVYPNERRFFEEAETLGPWQTYPIVETLKPLARTAGLWNLFAPPKHHAGGLANAEYAHLCETMGRSLLAPEVFNCSAPDTGNMETLMLYGTAEQQAKWLAPLLAGEIRSCFAMTEPAVASSDATNVQASIVRDGDEYVLNGHKWYATGGTDPRCKICIFMGKSDPDNPDRHKQQSMILVPMDTPGVDVKRPIPVFGEWFSTAAWIRSLRPARIPVACGPSNPLPPLSVTRSNPIFVNRVSVSGGGISAATSISTGTPVFFPKSTNSCGIMMLRSLWAAFSVLAKAAIIAVFGPIAAAICSRVSTSRSTIPAARYARS